MDVYRPIRGCHLRTELDLRAGATAKSVRSCMEIAAAAGMIWGSSAIPVRINWSSSAPVGLYTIFRRAPIARGDLVVVCLQSALAARGRARGYLAAGSCPNGTSPILKEVLATAGDRVELRSHGIAVNGRAIDRSPRRNVDSLGRSLELVPLGRSVVRDGEVWVLGVRRERSWDSRYFGPIPASSLVGVARPLFTMNLGKAP